MDPGCGRLDFRCQLIRRAAGHEPPESRLERLALELFREPVERVERDRGLRQRFRGGDVGAVTASQSAMASSRSARSMGERPNVAPAAARQRFRDSVDGGLLRLGQSCRAERAGRPFDLGQPRLEPLGAPRDGRRGVVQLVREARGQLAEGGHFLHLKVARRELAGPVDHDVHEDRGELVAFANQRRDLLARNHPDLGRLLGLHAARRLVEARVRQKTRHVAAPPLHDLLRSGAPVDVDRHVAGKDDVQAGHGGALRCELDRPGPIG